MRLLLIALISFFLSSCGYHMEEDKPFHSRTISVPYFNGDQNGELTDTIVKAITASGKFSHVNDNGDVILYGTVIEDSCENIGYQYDRDPISGKIINRLIPNEGRREIGVRVSLVDSQTQKILYGPFDISAYSDYDFVDSDSLQDTSFINSAGTRESVLFFSLGQLDSVDGAKEASLNPIYRNLALKIVEGISNLPYNMSPSE